MAEYQADDEMTPLRQSTRHERLNKAHFIDEEASSIIGSHITKDELLMGDSAVGERLPYNDYTTIDFLHDLVSRTLNFPAPHSDIKHRSKIRTVYALPTAATGFATRSSLSGTKPPAGSQQH